MAYITSTINQYERTSEECSVCTINNVVNDLTDLEDFIADLKEDVREVEKKDTEAMYVEIIMELETKLTDSEYLKEGFKRALDLNRKHSKELENENRKFDEELASLNKYKKELFDRQIVSQNEIIALEKEAEYSNALWNAVNSKLTKENEKLNEKINKLEFWR